MKTRPAVVFAGGVLVLLSLCACDNNAFTSPLALRADGDLVVVAMCGPTVEIERIYLESRNQDLGVAWFRFWDAKGTASLETGEIVSLRDGVQGLSVELTDSPILEPGTDIAITMVSVERDMSLSSDFVVGPDGLSEDSWLRVDGSVSALPCDGIQ